MKLVLQKSEAFLADFDLQYGWYLREAGERIAERYLIAVEETLRIASVNPHAGRFRKFRVPALRDIRSFRVVRPFGAHLVFYRQVGNSVFIERVMHGARDLARRLAEPPGGA